MTVRARPADPSHLDRVVAWFITLRWVACAGVIAALLTVGLLLRYPMPYLGIAVLTGALILANGGFTLYFARSRRRAVTGGEMNTFLSVQIWSDYLLLFLLVYLGGFLENPFSYYFVFHVMLSAYLFPTSRAFFHVGALLLAGIAAFVLGYLCVTPTFSLTRGLLDAGAVREYWRLRVPQAIGLGSTLLIAAYLMVSIKRRFEEKGRWVAVELDRYRSLDRIKSNFILQVTHELRGPLAAANGYHEMVLRGITGPIPDRTREAVVKATRRVDNLLTMIDEMIDYAYMSSGSDARYEATRLRVAEVVDRAVEMQATQANAKEIRIVRSAPRELELWANRDLMNIVIGNLISNAVKYSPVRSTVMVSAAQEGGETHFMVKDEGMGIEADELDKIFEEFYRTRRAREREKDGTGLGLVITKRAVETLHGRIRIYSEVDKGTEFHVFLPRRPPQETAASRTEQDGGAHG